jgi:hypothetical protein
MKMQPQPIDDCLRVLGLLLAGGEATPPVMASHAAEIAGKKKEDGEIKVRYPLVPEPQDGLVN